MILIKKTTEPASWTEHRLTEGAQYEATKDLRNALLRDQGYICAYCMRRIPVTDKGTGETTRIEHIYPQSGLSREEAMDFGNMVICCPGAMATTADGQTHCDRHKKETKISFSPLDANFISTISYGADGTIRSSVRKYSEEMDSVLNLNQSLLKLNRKAVWAKIIEILGKKDWKKADIEKVLKTYTSRDKDGKLKEYCGIAIYLITKRLRRYQH